MSIDLIGDIARGLVQTCLTHPGCASASSNSADTMTWVSCTHLQTPCPDGREMGAKMAVGSL